MNARLPLAVAALGVLGAFVAQLHPASAGPDFGVFWTAGHAAFSGHDPYQAVLELRNGYPFFYPPWTAFLLVPLGALPYKAAWLVFAGLSGLAYGYASQQYGRGLVCGALSACFMQQMAEGQWAPLLVAACVLPSLGALLAAKPSLGLALFTAKPTPIAALACLGLVYLGVWLIPNGWGEWMAALRQANHVAPVLRPGGFLLLLGWLRWRIPEGRLLGTLALVPHTTALGDALPLFLVPRTRWEGYGLAVLTYVAVGLELWLYPTVGRTLTQSIGERWPVVLVCCYLPALVMALRPLRQHAAGRHPVEARAD